MRAASFKLEDRSVVDGGLIDLTCVLRDQLAYHFKMAEFLDRNVLQHVTDAGIFDVKGLHPVLQCSCQLTSGPSELLEQKLAEAGVGRANIDRLNKLFAMEEHCGFLCERLQPS